MTAIIEQIQKWEIADQFQSDLVKWDGFIKKEMILVAQEPAAPENNNASCEEIPITIWNQKKEEQNDNSFSRYRMQSS